MILYLLILTPLIFGLLLYLLPIPSYKTLAYIMQSGLMVMAFYLFYLIDLSHETNLIHQLSGYDSHLTINLVADNISAFLIIITTVIFMLLLIMDLHKTYINRLFLCLFLVLEGLIIGLFLSRDLFNLYALIEVATILVSILILYKKEPASIYDGIVYLLTNIIAMTFFLMGIGYIYKIFGTMDMELIEANIALVSDQRQLILPYVFIMTAILLKAAIVPVFSWLPRAHGSHSAPYIVSALLSGLYIKGSLYLFIRIHHLFEPYLPISNLFIILGLITGLAGAYLALCQTDIKLLLAYSTVSQIGLMIYGIAIGSTFSYYGTIYHIFSHSFFKVALFLIAGLLIDHYGTRRLADIQGLFSSSKSLSIFMVTALLGVTGAPFFSGGFSKALIQKATGESTLLYLGLLILNVATLSYSMKLLNLLPGKKQLKLSLDIRSWIVLGILSLGTFLGGLLGVPFMARMFELDIHLYPMDYLIKAVTYAISGLIAYGLYLFNSSPYLRQFTDRIRQIELSFNELIFAIVLSFGGLMGYLFLAL